MSANSLTTPLTTPATTSIPRAKSLAIVFCRLSRLPDEERGTMSLDSQEYAIQQALSSHGIGVFMSIKTVGSGYHGCYPQQHLINVLQNSKNKVVYVYEPNRLSRNVMIFDQIVAVCQKNHHCIFVVTLNRMFGNLNDLNDLRPFIVDAELESYEMGRRISRTAQYKKSRETVWGKMHNERNEIVDNPHEQKINHLIRLLNATGSSVAEIANLIHELGVTEGKEPFALVEYDSEKIVDLNVSHLPYGMSPSNIVDTLKYYEIRHRKRLNWTTREIVDILQNRPTGRYQGYNTTMDSLTSDFEILGESKEKSKEESKIETNQTNERNERNERKWMYIWYDPAIGLPPNVRLPPGMTLPNYPCELCIPKM